MAIYRLEAKIFSREGRSRSVVAASAYRSAGKLKDERAHTTHDYTRRSKGVVETTVLCPQGSPSWVNDPTALWNRVEQQEKRKDAQLAREFILAVPKELAADDQFKVAVAWANKELIASGMVAEISLHHPKNGKNPHVHILCTMRRLDGDGFSAKKATEWNDVKLLVEQRASWAAFINEALENAGRSERVDHRSLKDRGIDRQPEPKIGVAATAMKRRGAVEDTERHRLARRLQLLNEVRPWTRAIERFGEVRQQGMGSTWWERTLIFAKEAAHTVRDAVLDTWATLIHAQLPGRDDPGLGRDREPDLER